MLNLRKPAFIFILISVVLFMVGLFMKQKEKDGGATPMYIGLSMAVIYWFWAIIEVAKAEDLRPDQKKFWLIIVITIPAVGGALFHIMHQRRNKIVT